MAPSWLKSPRTTHWGTIMEALETSSQSPASIMEASSTIAQLKGHLPRLTKAFAQ